MENGEHLDTPVTLPGKDPHEFYSFFTDWEEILAEAESSGFDKIVVAQYGKSIPQLMEKNYPEEAQVPEGAQGVLLASYQMLDGVIYILALSTDGMFILLKFPKPIGLLLYLLVVFDLNKEIVGKDNFVDNFLLHMVKLLPKDSMPSLDDLPFEYAVFIINTFSKFTYQMSRLGYSKPSVSLPDLPQNMA